MIRVNKNIKLTKYIGPKDARLTKKFVRDEEGHIRKQSAPLFYKGHATTLTIKQLSDIEGITQSLDTNECIGLGVFNIDECEIVGKKHFGEDDFTNGIRTRSKDHLSEPAEKLAMLDHDSDPYMPNELQCQSGEELIEKIVQAIPEFVGIGYQAPLAHRAAFLKRNQANSILAVVYTFISQ